MLTSNSNLPTVQRLKYEDYADAKSWQDATQGLVNSLNLFISPVYQILNGNVGYSNLSAPQIVTKTITASATTTFNFVNPLNIAPSAVILGNVYLNTTPAIHPAVATQVMWHYSNGIVYIDNVIGLTAGISYYLSLVVF